MSPREKKAGRGRPKRAAVATRPKPISITLPPELRRKAQLLMERMDFSEFSPFVADMIRERWRRVFGDHYPPVDRLEEDAGGDPES